MKKLFTFFMVLVFCFFSVSGISAQQTEFLYASDYANLAAALTSIGSDECTLVVSEEEDVTANMTIPSNITLKFLKGGYLDIDEDKLVTINGYVEAGVFQIFAPFDVYSACVYFGNASNNNYTPEIRPEWFGYTMCRCGQLVRSIKGNKLTRKIEGVFKYDN